MIGILADDRAQPETVQQLVFAFAQMQGHFSAALRPLDHLDRVLAAAVRFPSDAVLGGEAGAARHDRHLVRDDERRVEPDPELADEMRVLRFVAGQLVEEFARAGLRDRADVLDHFLARHADAVVRDRDRARRLVERHTDLELRVAFVKRLVGERLEAQLVRRVGRVGNELAQKDLLVAVQGVNHQVQKLFDLGLEAERFARLGFCHLYLS